MATTDAATINPTAHIDPTVLARFQRSYVARRGYKDEVQRPPATMGVKGVIDIHCHAHEGQQDALAVAQHASTNGMGGILFKTIPGRQRPMETLRKVQEELLRWADQVEIEATRIWAAWNIGTRLGQLSTAQDAREQIADGIRAIWMPNNTHANTLMLTPNRAMLERAGKPGDVPDSIPWEVARELGGNYLLGEDMKLLPQVREVFEVIADNDLAVVFGHATHAEIYEMAEHVQRLGIHKAVVDHPFSPFVALSVPQMQELTAVGIYMNFTYDELSPLLGLNPAVMCSAIQELGTEYVTLSSDCGEPLFPNSVEAMRQIRAYMCAFGLSREQVDRISVTNPGKIVGVAPGVGATVQPTIASTR
jgi:predicted urease superfamily metal-dependent hydrolase